MPRKHPSGARKAPAKAGSARGAAKPRPAAVPPRPPAKAEKAPKPGAKAPEPAKKPIPGKGGMLAQRVAAKAAADAANAAATGTALPAKKKGPPKPKKPPVPRAAPRLKIVWAVCDHTLKTLKTFPYPERRAAELEASRLQKSKGKEHLVRAERVPMAAPPEAKPVAKRASP
jgi:hypothetical protein